MRYSLLESLNRSKYQTVVFDFEIFDSEFSHLAGELRRICQAEDRCREEVELFGKFLSNFMMDNKFNRSLQKYQLDLYFETKINFIKLLYSCIKLNIHRGYQNQMCNCLVKWLSRNNPSFSDMKSKVVFNDNNNNEKDKIFSPKGLLKLKKVDSETMIFKERGILDAEQVVLLRINDFNLGFFDAKVGQNNHNGEISSGLESKRIQSQIESYSVKCLSSAAKIGNVQSNTEKMKTLFYDYRYGWIRAKVNPSNDPNECIKMQEKTEPKVGEDIESKVEVIFPKIQADNKKFKRTAFLASIIDPNFAIPTEENYLPDSIWVSGTSPCLSTSKINKSIIANSINKANLYETIAYMNMNHSPLILRPLRLFKPREKMFAFLNEIFSKGDPSTKIFERANQIREIEECFSYENFEHVWYIIYFLRESLFVSEQETILRNMVQFNTDMCDGKFLDIDRKKVIFHFQALRHLLQRVFSQPLARALYCLMLRKFLRFFFSKSSENLFSIKVLIMVISNFRDISFINNSSPQDNVSEPIITIRSFMHYRPLNLNQFSNQLSFLLSRNQIYCQTTLDIVSRLVNKSFNSYFYSIWRLETHCEDYGSYIDHFYYLDKRSQVENSVQFKMLLLMIDKNPQYYTNVLQRGMELLDFDALMYIYVSYALDHNYSLYYKDHLRVLFSNPNAIKSFLSNIHLRYDEFDDSWTDEMELHQFTKSTNNAILKYIALNYRNGSLFNLEDFKLICYILLNDVFYDERIIFKILKMVIPEYSQAALRYITEMVWMTMIYKSNKIDINKLMSIFEGYGDLIYNCEYQIDLNSTDKFLEAEKDFKKENYEFWSEKRSFLTGLSRIKNANAEKLNVFKHNINAFFTYKLTNLDDRTSAPLSLVQKFYPDLVERTVALFGSISLLSNEISPDRNSAEIATFELYGTFKSKPIFKLESATSFNSLYSREKISNGKIQSRLMKGYYLNLEKIDGASFYNFQTNITVGIFQKNYWKLLHCKRYMSLLRKFDEKHVIGFIDFQHFLKHLLKKGLKFYEKNYESKWPSLIYSQKFQPLSNCNIRLSPNHMKSALEFASININSRRYSTINLQFRVDSKEDSHKLSNSRVHGSHNVDFKNVKGKKRIVLRRKSDRKPLVVVSLETLA
jgi:hypothetical protein